MFKKRPSKAELRDQLNAEVNQYLQKGGEIEQVEMGESGLVDGRYNHHKTSFDNPGPTERTPVHALLSTIDSRRKNKTASATIQSRATPPKKVPKQKVIYDDFGDPIRTVWVEE
ncbi:hypothetical protein [Neptuniibacter marinus]|jgi:hypothetical protein|uniref:hypothetical protein n=1 Tax=Neptuniibacter marinus TaxID=1806670 RepID=UPI003B5CC3AA